MVLIITSGVGKDNDPDSLFDDAVFNPAMAVLKASMTNNQAWDKVRRINEALISQVNGWYGSVPH